MSTTPTLSKAALYHSHLVNCKECHTKITGNPSLRFSWKIVDLLCPVGRKLFYGAVKEDPKSPFRPTSFPFVAKLYEIVVARVGKEWVKGKVVDFGKSADNVVMGYEIEYEVPSKKFAGKVDIKHIYVNRYNVHRAGDGTPPKAAYEVKTRTFKLRIGEKPKPEPIQEKPKFRFITGG